MEGVLQVLYENWLFLYKRTKWNDICTIGCYGVPEVIWRNEKHRRFYIYIKSKENDYYDNVKNKAHIK